MKTASFPKIHWPIYNQRRNKRKYKFELSIITNCWFNRFVFEWNCTNCLNCCIILYPLSFTLTLSMSQLKLHLISSVIEIRIKGGAIAMIKAHSTANPMLNASMKSRKMANEYPIGFFTSKGNLEYLKIVSIEKKIICNVLKAKILTT